jgi:hypothetical protein
MRFLTPKNDPEKGTVKTTVDFENTLKQHEMRIHGEIHERFHAPFSDQIHDPFSDPFFFHDPMFLSQPISFTVCFYRTTHFVRDPFSSHDPFSFATPYYFKIFMRQIRSLSGPREGYKTRI